MDKNPDNYTVQQVSHQSMDSSIHLPPVRTGLGTNRQAAMDFAEIQNKSASNLVDLAEEQKSSFNYIEPEEAKARIPNYEPREGEEEDYTVEIPRHRRFQN